MSEFENLDHSKSIRFDESGISRQKNCVPGPNVKFRKGELPFSAYLNNWKKEGSLGCGPGQYPKYTNGKYCCEDHKATTQEMLDYVNMLLEGVMKNVSITAFTKKDVKKQADIILNVREIILDANPSLHDNLDVPDEYNHRKKDYVNAWFKKMNEEAANLARAKSNPSLYYRDDEARGIRKRKNKHSKKNKSKKSKKTIKKRK